MRWTGSLDDDLLRLATRLTGIRNKAALVHAGLEALIARESARRLAKLGASEPHLRPAPRRRSSASLLRQRTTTLCLTKRVAEITEDAEKRRWNRGSKASGHEYP